MLLFNGTRRPWISMVMVNSEHEHQRTVALTHISHMSRHFMGECEWLCNHWLIRFFICGFLRLKWDIEHFGGTVLVRVQKILGKKLYKFNCEHSGPNYTLDHCAVCIQICQPNKEKMHTEQITVGMRSNLSDQIWMWSLQCNWPRHSHTVRTHSWDEKFEKVNLSHIPRSAQSY